MSKILVPIPDDGFAPDFFCGQFAIIDTALIEPEDGAYVYRRASRNILSIVKLRRWTPEQISDELDVATAGTAPVWSLIHRRQRIHTLAPVSDRDPMPKFIQFADGPLCDAFLHQQIIGRVVGIAGIETESLYGGQSNETQA